jgi:hypothetical protein
MYVLAFFTHNGIPETGLIPTVRIRDISDDSLVITDSTASEVGDGWYKYDFTSYDGTKEYAITFDGGSSLIDSERYTYGSNDSFVEDIVDEVWKGKPSEHLDPDSFSMLLQRIAGLIHENTYIDNTVYDNNKNLVAARVRLYSNPASVGTDSNVIGTYNMISQGEGIGKFTNWKQTKD